MGRRVGGRNRGVVPDGIAVPPVYRLQPVRAGTKPVPDESKTKPAIRREIDRLEHLDILQRFRGEHWEELIALTPRARRLSKEELILEMIDV